MRILIAYDVATADPGGPKRLRGAARACQDYGQRVQKSVFECSVEATDWVLLKDRLLGVMDLDRDSLRVYFLERDVKVEHHGVREPPDLDGPLVV
jgi:CRISPR-associated protein Cas2